MLQSPENIAPFDVPLWFVRNLILLLAITPVIYYLIKRAGKITILILCLAYISKIWIQYTPFTINGVFFFTLGCYLSINRQNIAFCFDRYRNTAIITALTSCVICTICYAVGQTRVASALMSIYILTGVITAICFASHINKEKTTKVTSLILSLAPTSFFIFAIHTILINPICGKLASKIFHALIRHNDALADLISYLIAPIMVACICLAAFYLMKKTMPRLLSSLTGDRM